MENIFKSRSLFLSADVLCTQNSERYRSLSNVNTPTVLADYFWIYKHIPDIPLVADLTFHVFHIYTIYLFFVFFLVSFISVVYYLHQAINDRVRPLFMVNGPRTNTWFSSLHKYREINPSADKIALFYKPTKNKHLQLCCSLSNIFICQLYYRLFPMLHSHYPINELPFNVYNNMTRYEIYWWQTIICCASVPQTRSPSEIGTRKRDGHGRPWKSASWGPHKETRTCVPCFFLALSFYLSSTLVLIAWYLSFTSRKKLLRHRPSKSKRRKLLFLYMRKNFYKCNNYILL